jgi:transposase-like protein
MADRRMWSDALTRQAMALSAEGLNYTQIADRMGWSVGQISKVMANAKTGYRYSGGATPENPGDGAMKAAKEALAWEIQAAIAERDTAPPFKDGPLG